MAARPTITGRGTSLAHAFVHAIIPRDVDPVAQAELFAATGMVAPKPDAKPCRPDEGKHGPV
ncbi:hypothetical protein [Mesorhizobium sp. M0435]|uniref:hypothetical protein n=1 Tax=Mesorhizobium sp. M0435 TaxID=2956944 RepID=UPI00333540F9